VVAAALTRRYGGRETDLLVRVSAALAALAIPVSLLAPDAMALVPFLLFTVWTNGPLSPVLPASYEPVLMLYGKLYPPLLIGALGTTGVVFIEYVNYRVYAAASDLRAFRGLRDSKSVVRLTRMFERNAFLTIVVCAVAPFPYWVARVLSVLARYPLSRHLAATALGRFPRLCFFAALSAPLAISNGMLIGITAGSMAAAGLLYAIKHAHAGRPRPTRVPRSTLDPLEAPCGS
jgi:uncharacterized membrane protein YdjX (TVP38/TMEM64 family)